MCEDEYLTTGVHPFFAIQALAPLFNTEAIALNRSVSQVLHDFSTVLSAGSQLVTDIQAMTTFNQATVTTTGQAVEVRLKFINYRHKARFWLVFDVPPANSGRCPQASVEVDCVNCLVVCCMCVLHTRGLI